MQETIIKIEGMSCGHCKAAVEKALKAVPGVETAVVNLEEKQAVVTGNATMHAVGEAIEDAGYEVF